MLCKGERPGVPDGLHLDLRCLDARAKLDLLDRVEGAAGKPKLLDDLRRIFERFGKLGEPARTRDGESFIRHLNHAYPPALVRRSVPRPVNFALGSLRSGAEIV